MCSYTDRLLRPSIFEALEEDRIVALLGARQTGKSTLCRRLSESYFSLNDPATRQFARSDPGALFRGLPPRAVVDEIQRAPDLLLSMKSAVDADPRPGRFIITGSFNILSLPRIADTLTGRSTVFELEPFAESEIVGSASNAVDRLFTPEPITDARRFSVDDVVRRILRGGFPAATRRSDARSRDRWFDSCLTTILQREVRDLARVGDIDELERLFHVASTRTAQMLSPTNLASDMSVSRETVRRYLVALEQLYLLRRAPAWTRERGRRAVASPKFHLCDTGFAAHRLELDEASVMRDRTLLGRLLETFVFNELHRQASWSRARPKLFHWRTSNGTEVDVVLERRNGKAVAVGVKASASPTARDARGLRALLDDHPETFERGVLLYLGEQIVPISEKIIAVPVSWLWSLSA